MKPKKRFKLYNKYEKPILKKSIKSISKYLKDQGIRVAKVVAKTTSKKEMSKEDAIKKADKVIDQYDFAADVISMNKILFPLAIASGELGNDLSNFLLYTDEEDEILYSVIEENYIKHASKYAATQSKFINQTSKKEIKKVIADGMLEGETYEDIAKKIVKHTTDRSIVRARMIAETEIHSSFMVARDLNANAGGFKEKAWMDSADSSVRPWHQVYDNLGWVSMDYLWGGTMRFPGDPMGTPRETIRCRCEISYR